MPADDALGAALRRSWEHEPAAVADPVSAYDRHIISFVNWPREVIARNLRAYGEHDVAERVLEIDERTLDRVYARANHYLFAPEHSLPSGTSMIIYKALALAAVAILEGEPRDLRRKRRDLSHLAPGDQR